MTVLNDTMLCLRWNNPSSKLNLSEAFQELRNDADFFDVSLGCANGSKGNSLKAHKLILSAYSNVFKEVLKQHSNHNDPFIYLKGVSYDELSAMLDFMYQGEVYVSQSNLNAFLTMAKDLQVKGLTENVKTPKNILPKSVEDPFTKKLVSNEKDMKIPFQPDLVKKEMLMKKYNFLNKTEEETKSKFEKMTNLSSWKDIKPSLKNLKKYRNDPLSMISKLPRNDFNRDNPLEDAISEKEEDSMIEEANKNISEENQLDDFEELPPGTKGTVKDLMFRMGRKIEHGKKMRQLAKCKLCSKEGRTDHIQNHIKSAHQQSLITSDPETPQHDKFSFEMDSDALKNLPEENISNEEGEEDNEEFPLIDDFIENMDKRVQQGVHNRKFARCKLCSKECRSDNIRLHIKNTHGGMFRKVAEGNKDILVKTEIGTTDQMEDKYFSSAE